ncbi:LexA family transcriptional regulator [Rahnella sp. FC061912-K]|jgi:SOS-response transcriptional repressor LexA|uniref:LexA family protein n=1 Tax=Rahnella rivi TaxID=2816249 RepID=UPI001C26D2FD|nr:LexA family transcriptional regulator [Rahnella rivi]MBU9830502.1 LexA family transcriptional regulator [Rahnella rivi]
MEMNERIRARRKELKLTQSVLAKLIGVNRVTVTGWESGDYKPGGENLQALAGALECNPQWLVDGKGDPLENAAPASPPSEHFGIKEIPVLSWVQAGEWTESGASITIRDVKEWIYTTAAVSSAAFALRVRGDSMTNPTGAPSIPEGSMVVVDPDRMTSEDSNGKIVVAQLIGSTEATLKKYVVDGPQKYLVPLNPSYRPLEVNGNCKLVGIVRQVIMDL